MSQQNLYTTGEREGLKQDKLWILMEIHWNEAFQ
jgi:hypothetical protein